MRSKTTASPAARGPATRRGRLALGAGLALALALPGAAPAAAAAPARAETLTLDAHEAPSDGAAGPVATRASLARGRWHLVRASGTFSYYGATAWTSLAPPFPVVCGTPEPAPLHPSPGTGPAPVGFDLETIFARPWTAEECGRAPLPLHWANFQMDLGGGFAHREPDMGQRTSPRRDHVYTYALRGRGRPLQFRLADSDTSDNSGMARIEVRAAGPRDCAGRGWRRFKASSRARCVAALRRAAYSAGAQNT